MGDGEWMARLRAFASSGVWPSGGGNMLRSCAMVIMVNTKSRRGKCT